MQRYFLEIAYMGKNYSGWQIQPNAISVQATLESKMSLLLGEKTDTLGCGRTDAGVHASQFFLHFDTASELPIDIVTRLNKMLPHDIAVKQCIAEIPAHAHARFDATYRAYDYHMHFFKNPFKNDISTFFPEPQLDAASMYTAANLVLQYDDFPMFCKTGGAETHTRCNLFKSELKLTPEGLTYHIAANRFLRGMVRRIVGTLIMVGRKKISVREFEKVLIEKGSFKYNMSVQPQGLFLSEVRYPFIAL